MRRAIAILAISFIVALMLCPLIYGEGPTITPCGLTRSGISFEVLTAATLAGNAERKEQWKEDPTQSDEWRAKQADYARSGFDIFHHAPSGDYGSARGKAGTFVLSNASPGDRSLNRGLWSQLEKRVRSLVQDDNIVQVYTGPCYLPAGDGTIRVKTLGADRIWIPTHYAKAVVVESDGGASSWCWLIPNEKPKTDNLDAFRRSIDEVEFAWGFDCKWGLPSEIEQRLEAER